MTNEEVLIKIKEYIGRDKKIAHNAKYDHILFYISSILNSFSTFDIKEGSDDLIITGVPNITSLNSRISGSSQSLKLLVQDGKLFCDSTIIESCTNDEMQVDINQKVFEASNNGFLVEKTYSTINNYRFGQLKDKGDLRIITSSEDIVYDDLGIMKSVSTKMNKTRFMKDANLSQAYYHNRLSNGIDLEYEETISRNNDKFWEVGYSKRYSSDISKNVETRYLLDAYYDFTDFTGFIEPDRLSQEETIEHIQDGIHKTLMRNPEASKRFEQMFSSYLIRMNDSGDNSKTR